MRYRSLGSPPRLGRRGLPVGQSRELGAAHLVPCVARADRDVIDLLLTGYGDSDRVRTSSIACSTAFMLLR